MTSPKPASLAKTSPRPAPEMPTPRGIRHARHGRRQDAHSQAGHAHADRAGFRDPAGELYRRGDGGGVRAGDRVQAGLGGAASTPNVTRLTKSVVLPTLSAACTVSRYVPVGSAASSR